MKKTVSSRPLRKPLGKRWKRRVDGQGYLTVTVTVDFDEALNHDVESFNDWLDTEILGDEASASLSDISWKVVGSRKGSILLEIRACPEEF